MSVTAWPDRLLSMADWDALPEDNTRRYEVAEGVLQVSPRPARNHQRAVLKLGSQVDNQLSTEFEALPDMEVVLDDEVPITVRVPDLVVARTSVTQANAARLSADDVVLAIEVVSPGSVGTDTVLKMVEYAEAGIEQYWIVDIDQPATVTVYRLIDGAYQRCDETTATLRVETPIPLTIDVAALTP